MVESFQKRDRDRRNALKRRDKEAKRREKSRVKRGDAPAPLARSSHDAPHAFEATPAPAPSLAPPRPSVPAHTPAPPHVPAPPSSTPRVLAPWLRATPAPDLAPQTPPNGAPRT